MHLSSKFFWSTIWCWPLNSVNVQSFQTGCYFCGSAWGALESMIFRLVLPSRKKGRNPVVCTHPVSGAGEQPPVWPLEVTGGTGTHISILIWFCRCTSTKQQEPKGDFEEWITSIFCWVKLQTIDHFLYPSSKTSLLIRLAQGQMLSVSWGLPRYPCWTVIFSKMGHGSSIFTPCRDSAHIPSFINRLYVHLPDHFVMKWWYLLTFA